MDDFERQYTPAMLRKRLLPLVVSLIVLLIVTYGLYLLREHQAHVKSSELILDAPDVPDVEWLPNEYKIKLKAAYSGLGDVDTRIQSLGDLAFLFHANGYTTEALKCYQILTGIDERNAKWFYFIAVAKEDYIDQDKVVANLRLVEYLDREYSNTYMRMGDAYFKLGQWDEAKAEYEERLKLHPHDPFALMGIAKCYMAMKQWELAKGGLLKAAESDTRLSEPHYLLSELFWDTGKGGNAKKATAKATQLDYYPSVPDEWILDLSDYCYEEIRLMEFAGRYLQQGDLDEAISLLEKAAAIDGENLEVLLALGASLSEREDWEQAKSVLEKALIVDLGDEEIYAQLVPVLVQLNELDRARQIVLLGHQHVFNAHEALGHLTVLLDRVDGELKSAN